MHLLLYTPLSNDLADIDILFSNRCHYGFNTRLAIPSIREHSESLMTAPPTHGLVFASLMGISGSGGIVCNPSNTYSVRPYLCRRILSMSLETIYRRVPRIWFSCCKVRHETPDSLVDDMYVLDFKGIVLPAVIVPPARHHTIAIA